MSTDATGGPNTAIFDRDEYSVMVIPPIDGGQTLAGVFSPESAIEGAAAAHAVGTALAPFLSGEVAYAPDVSKQTGCVHAAGYAKGGKELSHGIVLYRDTDNPADGVFLSRGGNFVMSTTGAVVVAACDNAVIAASATRDSLVDRKRIRGDVGRGSESVITSMMHIFRSRNIRPADIEVSVYCGYHPRDFAHQATGDENTARLIEYLEKEYPNSVVREHDTAYLNLQMIIAEQCGRLGFRFSEPHLIPADGIFAHARHHDSRMRDMRNLVLVSACA